MEPGKAWEGQIYDIPVEIDYTDHFILRYEKDQPGRPGVIHLVDERKILDIIHEAIPDIAEASMEHGVIEGIITSQSSNLNMSFVTRIEDEILHIVMKNMMILERGETYSRYSEDIVFQVAGKDAELRAAVVDHALGESLRPGRVYTPEVVYDVTLKGSRPKVSHAAWLFDTHVFSVR